MSFHIHLPAAMYYTVMNNYSDIMIEWIPFIAHAGLTIGLFTWLRSDINILLQETNKRFDAASREADARFAEFHNDIAGLHHGIQAIDVRLARVEATLETTFRLQGVLPADHRNEVA